MEPSEAELIARCQAGDRAAMERLYQVHAGWVMAYLRRCGFGPADVDDLAQDVFVRLMKSLHTFDPRRGALVPWLATVARNVARRCWRGRPSPDHLDPEMAEAVLAAAEDAAARPETREELRALRGCIEALPPDLARLVRLRYVEGMTTRGIADAARLPEATVRLRLDEARTLLEECLKSKGVGE
ncbi:MAG: RNA polymerase sigma factor [Planctomycetes bacterium]|nr:RNA polymerase sigma factor [Planctomycetota bacterium]